MKRACSTTRQAARCRSSASTTPCAKASPRTTTTNCYPPSPTPVPPCKEEGATVLAMSHSAADSQLLNAIRSVDLRARVVEGAQDDRPRKGSIQPPIRLQPSNMMCSAGLRAVRDPAAGLETPVQIGVTPGEAVRWNKRFRWTLLHSELRLLGGTIGESLITQHGEGLDREKPGSRNRPSQLRQTDGGLTRERPSTVAMKHRVSPLQNAAEG